MGTFCDFSSCDYLLLGRLVVFFFLSFVFFLRWRKMNASSFLNTYYGFMTHWYGVLHSIYRRSSITANMAFTLFFLSAVPRHSDCK